MGHSAVSLLVWSLLVWLVNQLVLVWFGLIFLLVWFGLVCTLWSYWFDLTISGGPQVVSRLDSVLRVRESLAFGHAHRASLPAT